MQLTPRVLNSHVRTVGNYIFGLKVVYCAHTCTCEIHIQWALKYCVLLEKKWNNYLYLVMAFIIFSSFVQKSNCPHLVFYFLKLPPVGNVTIHCTDQTEYLWYYLWCYYWNILLISQLLGYFCFKKILCIKPFGSKGTLHDPKGCSTKNCTHPRLQLISEILPCKNNEFITCMKN